MDHTVEYLTADGYTVRTGDAVFDYYGMEPIVIGRDCGGTGANQGWFNTLVAGTEVDPTNPPYGPRSTSGMLNGDRVCSFAHAKRMGWHQD